MRKLPGEAPAHPGIAKIIDDPAEYVPPFRRSHVQQTVAYGALSRHTHGFAETSARGSAPPRLTGDGLALLRTAGTKPREYRLDRVGGAAKKSRAQSPAFSMGCEASLPGCCSPASCLCCPAPFR